MLMQLAVILGTFVLCSFSNAASDYTNFSEKDRNTIAQQTEIWEPEPKEVTFNNQGIPSDALILFDGRNVDAWTSDKNKKIAWTVNDDILTVAPGTGSIHSKEIFCDAQFHIEWQSPLDRSGKGGQQWGNSGVFIQGRYEVQILNSHRNRTYSNGQAASIYKQFAPLVNATTPVGNWQTYDIIFTAPRFDKQGKLLSRAYITVLHNGVLVQNHSELKGPTLWIGKPEYRAHDCAPLSLQEHNDKVSFRNIWARKL